MIKIKSVIILSIILIFNVVSFAQVKTFVKEGESVVQKDQSVNQVIAYLKQKLTREAQEEAGTFITTNLKIENNKITENEITSFAGSISKITVLEEKSFMKNTEQYVKVKIKANVDIDNVKAYLEKIMQDNEYKDQAKKALEETEQLRKEKLELENKLKTASKKEYEQNLSKQVQYQIEQQKQREIELNKMAFQAKEEYIRIKKEQKQNELERQKKFDALQLKIEQEQLQMQQKISQEKNNIKKAELENKAKIIELENIAKKEQLILNTGKNKISIQQVVEDTKKIKENIKNINDKFTKVSQENIDNLVKSYDKQISIIKNSKFQKEAPTKKDLFETTEEFNSRLLQYNREKQNFLTSKRKRIDKLSYSKKEAINEDEKNTSNAKNKTLKPFINKLLIIQDNNYFYDKNSPKAQLLSFNDVNVDENYFSLTISYETQKYDLIYYFDDIGIEKAKLMYQTQKYFVIEPVFSVEEQNNNDIKQVLTAFDVKHLGTKIAKRIYLYKYIPDFSEIKEFGYLVKPVRVTKLIKTQNKNKEVQKLKSISENRCPYCHYKYNTNIKYETYCVNCKRKFK